MEKAPNQMEVADFTEAVEERVEELLSAVEVPENIPESLERAYRLEVVAMDLDQEDSNNNLRHVAWSVSRELGDVLNNQLTVQENSDFNLIFSPRNQKFQEAA